MESGDVVSLESLLGESLSHGAEVHPEVLSKIQELTSQTA